MSTRYSIDLTDTDHDRLRAEAERRNVSMSALVTALLADIAAEGTEPRPRPRIRSFAVPTDTLDSARAAANARGAHLSALLREKIADLA